MEIWGRGRGMGARWRMFVEVRGRHEVSRAGDFVEGTTLLAGAFEADHQLALTYSEPGMRVPLCAALDFPKTALRLTLCTHPQFRPHNRGIINKADQHAYPYIATPTGTPATSSHNAPPPQRPAPQDEHPKFQPAMPAMIPSPRPRRGQVPQQAA